VETHYWDKPERPGEPRKSIARRISVGITILQVIDNNKSGGEGGILAPPFPLCACNAYTYVIIRVVLETYGSEQESVKPPD
jgi:hypothetical protein